VGAAVTDTSIVCTNTSGNTWNVVYTVDAHDALGFVIYNITFTDTAGTVGTAVTTGSGSVTLPAVTELYFGSAGICVGTGLGRLNYR
jgi:hypothetical protein